jgi:hypothetical protein
LAGDLDNLRWDSDKEIVMAIDPLTAGLSLGKTIINKLFRDKVDEGELMRLQTAAELAVMENSREEKSDFRSFIVKYEGAAKDYKDIWLVGPIVLLFRGLIRPVITIMVGYLDFVYITTSGTSFTPEQSDLLKAMTVIVFMFWFGERMVKNTGLIEAVGKMFKK